MKELIQRYKKLDSPSISDALDSLKISGGLVGIQCRVKGLAMCGPAYTVKYRLIETESAGFKNAGNYIDNVPEGSIIVIDNDGRQECTTWGDILTNFAIKHNIGGTVIHGAARDIDEIERLRYPLFSTHIFMQSAKNRAIKVDENCEIEIGKVTIKPNDLIFGDSNGCVAIPFEHIEEVLSRAENIQKTEQKIIEAVMHGISLEKAREQFGYAKPWENK